jgi:hypothetical protein
MRNLLGLGALAIVMVALLLFTDPGRRALTAFGIANPECTESRLLNELGFTVPQCTCGNCSAPDHP